MSSTNRNWWDTPEVQDFGRWLDSNGYFASPSDALDFSEEPWKWHGEFREYMAERRNEMMGMGRDVA